MLADLMLPDQMHNRRQDWTMFFLHKETNADEEDADGQPARRRRKVRTSTHDQKMENGSSHLGTNGDQHPESTGTIDEDESEEDDEKDPEEQPLIYVLNLVNTKVDSSVER